MTWHPPTGCSSTGVVGATGCVPQPDLVSTPNTLQCASVADSVAHRRSGLSSLSLLHAERQGGRASVKDPRVVKIAKDVIEPDLVCVPMLWVAGSIQTIDGKQQHD
jgi:hypothetical protein